MLPPCMCECVCVKRFVDRIEICQRHIDWKRRFNSIDYKIMDHLSVIATMFDWIMSINWSSSNDITCLPCLVPGLATISWMLVTGEYKKKCPFFYFSFHLTLIENSWDVAIREFTLFHIQKKSKTWTKFKKI